MGDGIINLVWTGDATVTIKYGPTKETLFLTAEGKNNVAVVTNLTPGHYWFFAFNECSITPLLDPLP